MEEKDFIIEVEHDSISDKLIEFARRYFETKGLDVRLEAHPVFDENHTLKSMKIYETNLPEDKKVLVLSFIEGALYALLVKGRK